MPPAAKKPSARKTAPKKDTAQKLSDAERAELEQLRKDNAERAERDQRQNARDRGQGPTIDLSDDDQAARAERYADWPERGGSELPQPWDHKAMGLQNAVRDLMDDQPAGAPNTVSPIVIDHGRPLLTFGSSDPSVQELGRILGALGFANSVSRGTNPFGSVDDTVMGAVHAFRDAYDVQEDPSGFGGNTPAGRERAEAHIGPWTWEAILRAGENATARA